MAGMLDHPWLKAQEDEDEDEDDVEDGEKHGTSG